MVIEIPRSFSLNSEDTRRLSSRLEEAMAGQRKGGRNPENVELRLIGEYGREL
jgi:hypothetical protein